MQAKIAQDRSAAVEEGEYFGFYYIGLEFMAEFEFCHFSDQAIELFGLYGQEKLTTFLHTQRQ